MKKFPVVLDLETKQTFREVDDHKKLGISVVAIYDYSDNKGKTYLEKDIHKLFPVLEKASYIIGYNISSFDLPVLQAYYPGTTMNFSQFDLLEDIRLKLGRRLALNDLVSTTLGKKKSGHGLMAIDYYKEKKWEELSQYCLDDVLLTKELFEFGIHNREIYYLNEVGKQTIKVDWTKYLEDEGGTNDMPLTLPF